MFYHLEKYEEAILDCDRAIEIDPTFTKVSLITTNFNHFSIIRHTIAKVSPSMSLCIHLRHSLRQLNFSRKQCRWTPKMLTCKNC